MKRIALMLLLLVGGCAVHEAAIRAERDCWYEAAQVPGARRADAFMSNDAMAPAAEKWREEIKKCMIAKGYPQNP